MTLSRMRLLEDRKLMSSEGSNRIVRMTLRRERSMNSTAKSLVVDYPQLFSIPPR